MIAALVLFIGFLLITTHAHATEGVVLNEIYAPTSNDDWVEIFNNSALEIDLSGWKIADSTSTEKTLSSDSKIAAHGFLTFQLSNRLNNSGDTVTLKNHSDETVDSFSFSSTKSENSFSRVPDGNGVWSQNGIVTKGFANQIAYSSPNEPESPNTEAPPTGKITLLEFMPNPQEGDEWAKVQNPNSFSLDISGWKIDDQEGGSAPFSIPKGTTLEPGQTQTFYFSARLNNKNDSVRLLSPTGEVIESFAYSETVKGISFVKDKNGSWVLANSPTIKSSQPKDSDNRATAQDRSITQESENQAPPILGEATKESKQDRRRSAPAFTKDNSLPPISILLIAAGVSTLLVAPIWPILEKRFFRKKKSKN